ncbi:peptide chain release factor family protein [Candidatus Margulisiibacteriota bacterium]
MSNMFIKKIINGGPLLLEKQGYFNTNNNIIKKQVTIIPIHASGHGGQKVNKTSSAVKIIHKPSGFVFKVQDTRYLQRNIKIAMQRLREKLISMNKANKRRMEVLRHKNSVGSRSRPKHVQESILAKKHRNSTKKNRRRGNKIRVY